MVEYFRKIRDADIRFLIDDFDCYNDFAYIFGDFVICFMGSVKGLIMPITIWFLSSLVRHF